MADVYHQVTITGLVIQQEGEIEPECWPIKTLQQEMIEETINVSSMQLKAAFTQKRAYTCSICGGRHSARFCPNKNKGGEE
tara:strand:- start:202 stop:444 length:243 start_codon:yes stop_codon:yes gene_type:complete